MHSGTSSRALETGKQHYMCTHQHDKATATSCTGQWKSSKNIIGGTKQCSVQVELRSSTDCCSISAWIRGSPIQQWVTTKHLGQASSLRVDPVGRHLLSGFESLQVGAVREPQIVNGQNWMGTVWFHVAHCYKQSQQEKKRSIEQEVCFMFNLSWTAAMMNTTRLYNLT